VRPLAHASTPEDRITAAPSQAECWSGARGQQGVPSPPFRHPFFGSELRPHLNF
jgi:hypothetical protein